MGKKRNDGCTDRTLPKDNTHIAIHYPLYFALPGSNKKTTNWGHGGVAFISPHKDEETKTLCRMWKITKGQYIEVKKQEGSGWYNKEIEIGKEGGIPIYTITNKVDLANVLPPSEAYLKTIALGLRETCKLDNEEIADYLIEKKGINYNYPQKLDRAIRCMIACKSSKEA
ncbi:MAG: hypothetical protein IMF10_08440, partial [Proteobacteria bacterium]|nr:hypothetical protein [Pseudomonadota bacterium]